MDLNVFNYLTNKSIALSITIIIIDTIIID